MCIIAIKPQGQPMWSNDIIENMFTRNHDGAGFMYYDDALKKVVIKKGYFILEDLIKDLNSEDYQNTTLVLHCRIGTSGKRDELNCHPYPIYDENKTNTITNMAMAHNGVLHDYTPPVISDINDTQYFIQTVLSQLKPDFIRNKDKLLLIEHLIGIRNKFAILDENNRLTMIGHFIEDGGYYYSNESYKSERKKATKKSEPVALFGYDDDLFGGYWK